MKPFYQWEIELPDFQFRKVTACEMKITADGNLLYFNILNDDGTIANTAAIYNLKYSCGVRFLGPVPSSADLSHEDKMAIIRNRTAAITKNLFPEHKVDITQGTTTVTHQPNVAVTSEAAPTTPKTITVTPGTPEEKK